MKTEILEEIIEVKGECLKTSRCQNCPFRNACLPEFATNTGQLTHEQRFNLALDILAEITIMDDIPSEEDINRRVRNSKWSA